MLKRVLIPFRHEHKVLPYVKAVSAGGMEPVPANVLTDPDLEGVAGLVLAGGTDVNPALYNAVRAVETDEPDDERDEVESRLLAEALRRDIPVLAICRGMQLLNVHLGGTLIQHLGRPSIHDPETEDKGAAAHNVQISRESLLGRIAAVERWQVNSRHHQAAERLGCGLSVVARAPDDNIVEAVEMSERRFVIGVQWHPEDQIESFPEQLNLFRSLAESL